MAWPACDRTALPGLLDGSDGPGSRASGNGQRAEANERTTVVVLDAVTVIKSHPVDIVFDTASGRLVLSGGSCDGTVALDGSMQLQHAR